MTTRIKQFLIAFSIFILVFVILSNLRNPSTYNAKIFRIEEGWGYEIELAGETYIHQPFVPSLPGNVPFPSKKMAKKTASLVIEKLENGKIPSITTKEMENLGIFISDN